MCLRADVGWRIPSTCIGATEDSGQETNTVRGSLRTGSPAKVETHTSATISTAEKATRRPRSVSEYSSQETDSGVGCAGAPGVSGRRH